MSTFSPSKNKVLIFTLILSLLIHFLILTFIDANRNPSGNLISLKGSKSKIAVRIKQKTIDSVKKQTKNNHKKEEKEKSQVKFVKKRKNKAKVREPKIKKKISKKNNKTHQETRILNKETQKKEVEKNVEQKEKQEQKAENINRKSSNLSKNLKKEENKKPAEGGSLFSFLNWKSMYIKEVINSLDKNKQYPELAKEMGIQGTVRLLLTIDRNGNVEKIEIAESSGFPILDKNAVETVKKSKFPPFPNEIKSSKIKVAVYISYILK
ncbi:energy transducer TonB [Desulfurobacterium sp.]